MAATMRIVVTSGGSESTLSSVTICSGAVFASSTASGDVATSWYDTMDASLLPSAIGSSFGNDQPADAVVPRTRMIIAFGASAGRLSITLSTEFTCTSVDGGIGAGAAGGGGTGGSAVATGAAGGASGALFSAVSWLHPAIAKAKTKTAALRARAKFITPIPEDEFLCRHR